MTEEQNTDQNQGTTQQDDCVVVEDNDEITKKKGKECDRVVIRDKLTAYLNEQDKLISEVYTASWQKDLEDIKRTAIEMKDDLLKDKEATEMNCKQMDKLLPRLKKTVKKQLKKYHRANLRKAFAEHLVDQKNLNLDFYEGGSKDKVLALYEATKKLEQGLVEEKTNIENAYEQINQAEAAILETKELWYGRFLDKKEKYLHILDGKRESFLGKSLTDTFKSIEEQLDPAFLRTKKVRDFLVSNQNSPIRKMCFDLYNLGEKEEVIKSFVKQAKEIHDKALLLREEDVAIVRRKFVRELGKVIKMSRKTQLKF